MKKKNYNPTFNKFTNNKVILYVVASIALLSLFGHLMYSEFSAIILFFLIGGLTYSMTKNMTIVLGSAFIVTSLATLSSGLLVTKEGMKEGLDEWWWYPSGKKCREEYYKEGEKDGESKIWYPSGKIKSCGNFKKGKLEGLNEEWYEDGQLKLDRYYKEGKYEGEYKEWNEEDELICYRIYKDGELIETIL